MLAASRVSQLICRDRFFSTAALPPARVHKEIDEFLLQQQDSTGKWSTVLRIGEEGHNFYPYDKLNAGYDPRTYHTYAHTIVPRRILFSIPDKTWCEFLDCLSNQPVVDALGLREKNHRRLWPSYSFAHFSVARGIPPKDNPMSVVRARIISRYPFLQSVLYNDQYCKSISNWVTKGLGPSDAYEAFSIALGYGMLDLGLLQKVNPVLTPGNVERFGAGFFELYELVHYLESLDKQKPATRLCESEEEPYRSGPSFS